MRKIAVLVGSLRNVSLNRRMAHELAAVAPPSLQLSIVEIGDLPHYNVDLEPHPPAAWTAFRAAIRASDGLLFVTPEFNRSIPGVLKNALDVGSRPRDQNVFDGKPGAVVSLTVGALGAFGANHHLRQALTFLNVPTMQQPEAYISNANTLFRESGGFASEPAAAFATTFMAAFAAWVERFAAP